MNGPQDALASMLVLVFYVVILAVAIGLIVLVCYFLYQAAAGVPERFQQASPGQAFLLLIPCFGLVWIFIYTKNLAQGYQMAFRSVGQQTDDCGEQLGMWWGICAAVSIVPCVGVVGSVASLILMIMYLVKVSECRKTASQINWNRTIDQSYRPVGDQYGNWYQN
ncbi:MAG: hypothetical protein KDA96_19290 [Planctomycetaceae bacterium]|nr:hypothetical protein [Planctomycetaceae bacterium]